MPLRYATLLATCTDQPCPSPARFQQKSIVAFRFMHNVATDQDFVPPALLNGGLRGPLKCEHLALSFFDSLERARERYAKLSERVNAASRYGDHIGEIELMMTDGLMSEPSSKTGHIDLHPEENASFVDRVDQYHAAS